MHRIEKKHIIILVGIAVLLILAGFGLDNRLQVKKYDIYDTRIPQPFNKCVIAQISDLHCRVFGENQLHLIEAVKLGKPDIILLTGDIIDAYIRDYDSVSELLDGFTEIAPVYAVSGNHEDDKPEIMSRMNRLYQTYGVHFLNNESVTIQKDGASIFIYGLDDKSFEYKKILVKDIPTLDSKTFGILLYHRADGFDNLSNLGYGLVLSGHLHGGLIRLPFVGGILTPDGAIDFHQEYTDGLYTKNGTTLISNRGMAPSHGIPRIFNRPEVVFVTLHSK